jgi:hypothetical protein
MLREKILPTGIGHTTNCFLQVEGGDSSEDTCIYTPDNEKPQNIKVYINEFFLSNKKIYFSPLNAL